MYQQDLDNKKDALKAIYGIGADNTGTTASNPTTSSTNTQSIQQPYETNLYQRGI
nr:MAG TPA: hypothetical protein [Caudoviricetes sp.]